MKRAEGDVKSDAALPGSVAKRVEIEIKRGVTVPPAMTIPLDALPPILRVSTEFQQGSLDNEKLILDGTGFEKTELAGGSHILQLSSAVAGTITLEFETNAGQLPVIRKVESPQTLVVAVATLADRGQLTSSSKTLKVGVNRQDPQEVGEQAVQLSLLSDRNVLAFDDSKNPITVAIQSDATPRLTVFVGAQPNVGNLEVTETGRVEASVSVEPADKKSPARAQKLTNGKATFSRLLPKTYNVEVSAPGYEPARASVSVTKGDVATVTVTLKPVPTLATATLEIHGGTLDAEILLDGRTFNKLSSTGDLKSAIPIGKHRMVIRKTDFEDSQVIELDVSAGGTKLLSGADVTLRPFGWIEFNVLPTNSRITYFLVGGTTGPIAAKNGDAPHVKAGRYSITVKAECQQDYTDNAFEVEPGRGKAFNKTYSAGCPGPPPVPAVRVLGPEILTTQSSFALSGMQVPGVYSFKIKLHGLRKRAKWVVNFVDNKNYIEYEMDDKSLKYTIHQNGTERSGKPVPHSTSGSNADSYDVAVDLAANAIAISIGGQRVPIDTPPGNGNLLAGKFGFTEKDWDNFQFTSK